MAEEARKLPANWEQFREHQFKPGQSGNPSGRPKDSDRLAAYIRENTNGCREVAQFMLDVMRGANKLFFKPDHRMRAAEWLADRGIGKAKDVIGGDAPLPLSEFSDDEMVLLERIAARRAANAGGDPSGVGPQKAG